MRKYITTLLLPLVLALSAAYFMFRFSEPPEAVMVRVVTVTRNIKEGEVITSDDLSRTEFPAEYLPKGALTNPADAEGKYAKRALEAGDLLFMHSLSDAPIADPGFVLYPLSVNWAQAGLVRPNDVIDIYAMGAQGSSAGLGAIRPILSKVKVVYVLDSNGRSIGLMEPAGESVFQRSTSTSQEEPSLIVLALSPDQADILAAHQRDSVKIVIHSLREGADSKAADSTPGSFLPSPISGDSNLNNSNDDPFFDEPESDFFNDNSGDQPDSLDIN